MNRSDLIERIAEENNLSLPVAERLIRTVFGSMAETLKAGGRIEVRGFGSFEVRSYGAYVTRNPKTGKTMEIREKKSPFFKVGKELRGRILDGAEQMESRQ